MMLATYARDRGLKVAILDSEAENLTADQTAERIDTERPVLAAVVVYGHQPNASTQNMTMASAICQAMKQRESPVPSAIVGGHVAVLPERSINEEACDYAVRGEGFVTLAGLAKALRDGGNIEAVPGLMWRGNGYIGSNPAPPTISEVPRMAYDLLDMSKYRAHNHHAMVVDVERRTPYASLYTSLGCPEHCSFCPIQAPFKEGEAAKGLRATVNSYRLKPPEIVVREIDELVTHYGVTTIRISDEMFVLNPSHVLGICDLLRKKSYVNELNLWAYARIDSVRDGWLPRLREAGFRWLCYGIESASLQVLVDVDKGYNPEMTEKVVRETESEGIEVLANYIIGLPEDDRESVRATVDQAIRLNTAWANFYSAMAYPGSKLYRDSQAAGVRLPERWNGYSQHSYDTTPLPTRHLTTREVLLLRDEAFTRYFSRPEYEAMIEQRFGASACEHVREMVKIPLKRNLLEEPDRGELLTGRSQTAPHKAPR